MWSLVPCHEYCLKNNMWDKHSGRKITMFIHRENKNHKVDKKKEISTRRQKKLKRINILRLKEVWTDITRKESQMQKSCITWRIGQTALDKWLVKAHGEAEHWNTNKQTVNQEGEQEQKHWEREKQWADTERTHTLTLDGNHKDCR